MKASRVYRLLSVLVLFAMAFGLTSGPAVAQTPMPPIEKIDKSGVSLAEVEGHYGLLSQRQGMVKVVVELADEPAALVYAAAGGGVNRNAISQSKVQLNKIQLAQAAFTQSLQSASIAANEIYRTQRVYNGVAMELDSQDVKAVAALPGVKAIHPLISKELDHTTSVPLVGALQAWANTTPYQGEGIDIGVIDTGIDYTHKNFGGTGTEAAFDANNPVVIEPASFPTAKVVGGYDFAGNDYDASGDFGPTTPAPDPDPLDCNGHGSHVSGTAAGLGIIKATGANPAAGDYAGYAALTSNDYIDLFKIGPGMAPKANLYALKVFGCEGSTDVTDQAIEWAVDPNQDGDLSDHLDIINMSLGSSFGSENDTSAIASNNAVIAGVVVVTSAGNSGDVYYIGGSPGVAQKAISTANSLDSGGITGGFEVVNVTTPTNLQGLHPGVGADFGPALTTTGLTDDLILAEPAAGCSALTNAAAVAGKIALIDRGTCNFTVKVQNAQAAGATGVIVANNVAGPPSSMGGTPTVPITIPSIMTSLSVGSALKAVLAGGVVVRLTSQYDGTIVAVETAIEDTIASTSSRGPRRGDTGLKPDLTAPGDTVYSTAVGTGNGGTSIGGTSMSSPHVAGAMALLREAHPAWSVAQLKALVMNTAAHDIYTSTAKTTLVNPDRTGAGRLDVNTALNSELIAYSTDNPSEVSVSYGFQEVVDSGVGVDLTTDKSVTIANTGGSAVDVNVTFNPRYPANAGVTYSLPGVSNPVTIPAGGSVTVTVRQAIDASLLARVRDPGIATADGYGIRRDYLSQSGGLVVVTPVVLTEPVLRVPVYAAHRSASNRAAVSDSFTLGAADVGQTAIPMTGTTFNRSDDAALVYVHELLHESPDDTWSTGINNNADLMAVGASSDYANFATPTSLDDVALYIGLATYGAWSTPNEVEFDVFIDIDEDGAPDWVAFNVNTGWWLGGSTDVQVGNFCSYPDLAVCDFWYTINGYIPDTTALGTKLNGQQFNTNVLTLVLAAGAMDFTPANTDFAFYVDTYNREYSGLVDTTPWMVYDLKKQAFNTTDPVNTGLPVWLDSGNLSVGYDKTDLYNQGGSLGLLLNHHHNVGNKAEVVRFDPSYAALVWDKYAFLNVLPGMPVTIPVRVVNETDTNCTFDLAANQAPVVWPVTLSVPQQYVPAHGSAVIDAIVTVAPGAVPGFAKDITLTATCQQDNAIVASTILSVHAAYGYWLPLMAK